MSVRSVAKTATLSRLPATLLEIRRLFNAFDWGDMAREVEEESQAQVAIVGPVNSGKSTLFNTLKGREVSPVASVPGTTRELRHEQWGPFTLTDTPGFGEVNGVDRARVALQAVRSARIIVLVLDALSGVRQADYDLLQRLKGMGKPAVVAMNKIDLLKEEQEAVVADARDKLGEPDLIAISAKRGTNVATRLVPAMIAADPSLAVAVGRALPAYRRQAANRVIRQASMFNAVVGAEPVPGLDIPFLLATQARMVLRIASIYGESMSAEHAKELIATIVGGMTLRYAAREGAKFIPGFGWVLAAAVASAGTWAIGQVAVQYFEQGKDLSPRQLQEMYKQRVEERRRARRRRKEKKP